MWSIPSDKPSNTVYALSSVGLFVKSSKSELVEKIFYFPSKKCNQDRQKFWERKELKPDKRMVKNMVAFQVENRMKILKFWIKGKWIERLWVI